MRYTPIIVAVAGGLIVLLTVVIDGKTLRESKHPADHLALAAALLAAAAFLEAHFR